MNAKSRRHERRKAASLIRESDKNLAKKIESVITGASNRVNKALSIEGFRDIKLFDIPRKKLKQQINFTARGREKLVRGSIPLI